ncbi:transcriptional elongation regulator MINIYO [Typha latifolia]|uniref:transcriptional elongation regulator MINIYO n=1 Tax=Typha latifolia TaxID=4733 RepID=UPI003C2EF491
MESKKEVKKASSSKNPKTAAFSLKQRVEELHHATGLIGSIVEKGFSSSPASLPTPTVLPFPVARHRSHGPHWAPVSAVRDSDEEDMEEEGDSMDYDPVALFAKPLERKDKKRLEFSKWKEFVPKDDSAASRVKKRAGNGREIRTIDKKEGKRGSLPSISSTDVGLVHKEEEDASMHDNKDVLMRNSNQSELITRDERQPGMENMDIDALDSMNGVSRHPMQHNGKRNEQKHIINDAEPKVSLIDDIGVENLARLKEMSADEIAEARAEIMEKMDPAIVEMLKKRGQDNVGNRKGAQPERERKLLDSTNGGLDENGKISGARPCDWLVPGVDSSRSWKVWSERVEKVRTLRFSLDGNVMEIESSQEQHDGKRPQHVQYNADNVAERDFLRTEGDPASVGYTIIEAVALIRSMVPGQRALALQLLASIFNKALQNLQKMDINIREEINTTDRFVDWQAVWAFALGPEPKMALSLRIALDDNHDSVVLACAKVIQSILSYDVNEKFFDILEKLPTLEKDICTAPVFRGRPELDGGFLYGGFWKYNTKPSNIIPYIGDNGTDEIDGKHTIQDDIFVAEQDVAAGLIRMEILPRICYLLEMDPLPTLEDSLVSILVALARHSPQSADAILRYPQLIKTVVKMFTGQGAVEVHPSQIKAIILLKVLSQYNKKTCLDFVKHGVLQKAMWRWYGNLFTLENWIKSGREHCKLTSAMMVEQLRLWRVCIHYGFCISYFSDFFPVMCLWLSPPKFEKLLENDVLDEFTSVTREAYLVLAALAQKLPILHSVDQLAEQGMDLSGDYMEVWSWSHVVPIVELAISWLQLKNIPYVSPLIAGWDKSMKHVAITHLASLLWVISAILHMLYCILDRIVPDSINDKSKGYSHLPWLPDFVPKLGLEIIENKFINCWCSSSIQVKEFSTNGGSLAVSLSHLRHHSNLDTSLSSISCLRGLVEVVLLVDEVVRRAKRTEFPEPPKGYRPGKAAKILEEGITKWAQNDLTEVLNMLMTMVASEWPIFQSVEMFGRGGPAPGIGFGWGSSGGGFWSPKCFLVQLDAQLVLDLLNVFPLVLEEYLVSDKSMKSEIMIHPNLATLQRINAVLGVCLTAGPRERAALEKAFDILLQPSVLKFLDFCIHYLVSNTKGLKSFVWKRTDEDYLYLSKLLTSHYETRWLGIKRKSSGKVDRNNNELDGFRKLNALETISEEQEMPESVDPSCNSLFLEWAHQRLPLPAHWFLSAICGVGDPKSSGTFSLNDILDVARGGLFFLLGLEASSSLLCFDVHNSPICGVSLVWKLHSLSMALHVNMDVLAEENSKDVFEALQKLYGQHIDRLRHGFAKSPPERSEKFQGSSSRLTETQEGGSPQILGFQTTIHESYTTFVENLIEQFAAISYGDIVYGRQVAVYLHRNVEATVRLAAWNALASAYVLELLPPSEKCIAEAEGYLEPVEDNEEILEAYAKSWISGGLDRAATRGSVAFQLAVHHLSCFIFQANPCEKVTLQNKLARSLLRTYSKKRQNEDMLRSFVQHGLITSQGTPWTDEICRRFEVLTDACEGNSSLLAEVEKLRSSL